MRLDQSGQLLRIDQKNSTFLLMRSEEQEPVVLPFQEETRFVDGAGNPQSPGELVGKKVNVSCETKKVYAVMEHSGEVPHCFVLEEIRKQPDGMWLCIFQNGRLEVTVVSDAEVRPYQTRNIVRMGDLKAGDEVIVYYDAITLSEPARTWTKKIVLLKTAE